MVAADMAASSAAVPSSMSSSSNRRRIATSSGSIGASRLPAGMPRAAQQKISAATTFGPDFGGRGAWPDDLRVHACFECLARMVAMPTGHRAQLIEDPALPGLVRPRVAGCDRLRHGLALTHRQPHRPGLSDTLPSRAGAPHARILR